MKEKIKTLSNKFLTMKFLFPLTITGLLYFIAFHFMGKEQKIIGESFDSTMNFIGNISFILMAYYMYEQNRKSLEDSSKQAEEKNKELKIQAGIALYDRKDKLYHDIVTWFHKVREEVSVYNGLSNSISHQMAIMLRIKEVYKEVIKEKDTPVAKEKVKELKSLVEKLPGKIAPVLSSTLGNQYHIFQGKLRFFFKGIKLEKLQKLLREIYNLLSPLIMCHIPFDTFYFQFPDLHGKQSTPEDYNNFMQKYNELKGYEEALHLMREKISYMYIYCFDGTGEYIEKNNEMQKLSSEVLDILRKDFMEII